VGNKIGPIILFVPFFKDCHLRTVELDCAQTSLFKVRLCGGLECILSRIVELEHLATFKWQHAKPVRRREVPTCFDRDQHFLTL
jgi:hypothetical protein